MPQNSLKELERTFKACTLLTHVKPDCFLKSSPVKNQIRFYPTFQQCSIFLMKEIELSRSKREFPFFDLQGMGFGQRMQSLEEAVLWAGGNAPFFAG